MTLTVALQMDPVETININADSSFVLGLEALRRGHELHHYLPRCIDFAGGDVDGGANGSARIWARTQALTLRREKQNHATLGNPETRDLAEFNVILMRQDPPFDMAYITATHMLEHIHPSTLVVNDPVEVRNAPEKLFVSHFGDLMPPTIISSSSDKVAAFRAKHRDIIVKPLFGSGGAGVFHISPDNENLSALIEMFTKQSREPIIVQRYLPQVREGDKRIILIDGEAAGAVTRVPAAGEARANLHVGASAERAELSVRDQEICARIGPALKERGLIFAGIDVIGDYLTEINVTSPTGLQEINRFDGLTGDHTLEAKIWDVIEARLRASR
jgi:glutathione synthase